MDQPTSMNRWIRDERDDGGDGVEGSMGWGSDCNGMGQPVQLRCATIWLALVCKWRDDIGSLGVLHTCSWITGAPNVFGLAARPRQATLGPRHKSARRLASLSTYRLWYMS